jgi:hypothetical protein
MFLFGSGYIRNDMHAEWKRVRHIHQEFFYPLLSNRTFLAKAEKWVADAMQFKWDTSSLKILDNLVVGCQRIRKAPNTTPR